MVEEKSEKHLERKDERSNTTDRVSNEAQDELRNKRLNVSEKKTDNAPPKNANLPALELVDASKSSVNSDGSKIFSRLDSKDGIEKTVIEASDGRKSSIEFDKDGKAVKYTDFNNQEYINRGKINGENQPDVWVNLKNKVQPEGVLLQIDRENGTVVLEDCKTRIVKTTTANASENTQYPDGGGRTIRQFSNGAEFISIESTNRSPRSMKIENNRLTQYTDGEGTTFTLNGQKDKDGKPYYSGLDSSGNSIERNFTITADRTGNVVVRDIENPSSAEFARREYNNGTIVTSSADNRERKIEDSQGKIIDPITPEASEALSSPVIAETPTNADIEANAKYMRENQIGSGLFVRPVKAIEFADKIGYGKEWDYRSPGPDQMNCTEFESFGNWHYGYLTAAALMSKEEAKEAGGVAQQNQGTSKPEWGSPGYGYGPWRLGGTGTYGDDPEDTQQIESGYEAYTQQYRKVA